MKAAGKTGIAFDTVIRTYWGVVVLASSIPMSFCFHFKRNSFECGIPGLLTPNINLVVDFLRTRGYEFEPLEDDKVIETHNH